MNREKEEEYCAKGERRMSMRILFSRTSSRSVDSSRKDPPEKAKTRGRSMFRMGTDVSIPLKTGPGGVITSHDVPYISSHECDDEEDGAIELDVRCCCKAILLFVVAAFFVLSIFACGAAFATQDSIVPGHFLELQHNMGHNTQLVQQQPTQSIQPVQLAPAMQQAHANVTSVPQPEHSRQPNTVPIEYVELRYQIVQSRSEPAIGSLEACIRLVLQTSAFKLKELFIENSSILMRPDQTVGQASDLLIEVLSQKSTVEKVESCAKVVLEGEARFVYR